MDKKSNHCSNLISYGRVSLNSDLEIEDYKSGKISKSEFETKKKQILSE